MDKASNYSATASQGAGYKDQDKYEKEKNVSRYIFFFCEIYSFSFVSCLGFLNDMSWISTRAVDRVLKSQIKSDLKSRIKSDLSNFLTGRKPLLLWSF